MILRGQKLSVGVAHVRRHVGANSERVRAHLLRVPHDVLVRLLVRVQRQAQDGILPRDRRLKALSLVRARARLRFLESLAFPADADASSWSHSIMPNSCTRTTISSGSGKYSAGDDAALAALDELEDMMEAGR